MWVQPALDQGTHTVHARRTTMAAQLPLAPSLGAPALPHDDAGAWSSTLALVVSVLAATLGLPLAWLLKTRLDSFFCVRSTTDDSLDLDTIVAFGRIKSGNITHHNGSSASSRPVPGSSSAASR